MTSFKFQFSGHVGTSRSIEGLTGMFSQRGWNLPNLVMPFSTSKSSGNVEDRSKYGYISVSWNTDLWFSFVFQMVSSSQKYFLNRSCNILKQHSILWTPCMSYLHSSLISYRIQFCNATETPYCIQAFLWNICIFRYNLDPFLFVWAKVFINSFENSIWMLWWACCFPL